MTTRNRGDRASDATGAWHDAPAMASQPPGMPRLLVVDDEPNVGRSLRRGLSGSGWFVVTETDARRAIERHAAEPFDVVVTDIMMPGMDGTELIRALCKIAARPKIIAMSGGPTLLGIDFPTAAAKLGADAALAKPFRSAELQTVIARLLDLPPLPDDQRPGPAP